MSLLTKAKHIAVPTAVNVARFILSMTFIFSGFIKAVDPTGFVYKESDYLSAMGLPNVVPGFLLYIVALVVSMLEFCLGICLLFAIRRRQTSRTVLVFMAFMTLLTVWIYLFDPVKDCGCFGDALVLTNLETLLKNIVLLICSLLLVFKPMEMMRFVSRSNQWIVVNFSLLFVFLVNSLSLYDLPLIDFRPYHIGADIKDQMTVPEGAQEPQYETTFILEKDGRRQEFSIDNYPDSTWTFVDSKTVKTSEGYVPKIQDLTMIMADGTDVLEDVLEDKGYTFLLILPDIRTASDKEFGSINMIDEYCKKYGYRFYGLTASTKKDIDYWREMTGATYEFLFTDETTLKTMIRSNPGLMLLKEGKVVNKWSNNDLPELLEESPKLEQTEYADVEEESIWRNVLEAALFFFLPLIVLTVLDRLFLWTKWVRRRSKSQSKTNSLQTLNNKSMRKKIVAGNWKMNMNLQEGVALATELNKMLQEDKPNCGVIVCTPFIHLATVANILDSNVIGLGAENCADKEKGAFTGEVSAAMVKSTGAQYVILGHSERREYYKETPEILKEKVLLALKNGLKVIFCIGETLAEREANKQNEVVKAELEGSVFNLTSEEFQNITIAYEPIWAIGTGKTATSDQAEEIHAYIRSIVEEKYGKETAENTSILYGGSCKPTNAKELFAKADIDGGLIGGASLKAADFKGIIDAWK